MVLNFIKQSGLVFIVMIKSWAFGKSQVIILENSHTTAYPNNSLPAILQMGQNTIGYHVMK